MGRLVILAGPSCAGKTPLRKCLARCYPDMSRSLGKVVLYNSRPARIGEVEGHDYRFRARWEVEQYLDDDKYLGLETRGDIQALDLRSLRRRLETGDFLYKGILPWATRGWPCSRSWLFSREKHIQQNTGKQDYGHE